MLLSLDMVAIIKSVNKFAFSTYFCAVLAKAARRSQSWGIGASGLSLLRLRFGFALIRSVANLHINPSIIPHYLRQISRFSKSSKSRKRSIFLSVSSLNVIAMSGHENVGGGIFCPIFLTTCSTNYAFISQINEYISFCYGYHLKDFLSARVSGESMSQILLTK